MSNSNKFNIEEKPAFIIVRILIGRLGLFETPDILAGVESFLKSRDYPNTLIDLSGTAVIDSTGIGFLIAINNLVVKKGNKMVITGISERVGEIFRITKMSTFFKTSENTGEAEKFFTPGGKNQ